MHALFRRALSGRLTRLVPPLIMRPATVIQHPDRRAGLAGFVRRRPQCCSQCKRKLVNTLDENLSELVPVYVRGRRGR